MDIKELAKWIESNYTEEEINQYIKAKQAELDKLKAHYKDSAALCQKAEQLEKEGETLQAVALYDRLAVIYKKLKRPNDVIRVLEKAVYLFENVIEKQRADRLKKLEKYKEKLEKAKGK